MKRKRIAQVSVSHWQQWYWQELLQYRNNTKDKNHVEIINVSYDPTREFYEAYNKIFQNIGKRKQVRVWM